MNYPVVLHLLLALTAYGVQAIEISLTVDGDSMTVNGVVARGAVKCVAEINPNEPGSIKRLSVYRNKENSVLLVELSACQESINRTTNDIMVKGTLTPHTAEATLYLMTTNDCHDAEYRCEVIHVDKDGIEHSSASVSQFDGKFRSSDNPRKSIRSTAGQDVTSRVSDNTALSAALQLSAIIQQSQAYLAGKIERVQYMLHDKLFEIDTTLHLLEKIHSNSNGKDSICTPPNNYQNSEDYIEVHKLLTAIQITINETASDRLNGETALFSSLSRIEDKADHILIQSNNTIAQYKDTTNECVKDSPRPTTCPRSPSQGSESQYQEVHPQDGSPSYLCDTHGGWTVIQRRINGNIDFYRDWDGYKIGFGSLDGDFWLGLDQIHNITSKSRHELMVTLIFNGIQAYAQYSNFHVGREFDGYRLSVGGYTGTAGDSLSYSDNQKFSTHDKDNDKDSFRHCAQDKIGAWWYNDCDFSNLNGQWGIAGYAGPAWHTFSGGKPCTMTEMKIRSKI